MLDEMFLKLTWKNKKIILFSFTFLIQNFEAFRLYHSIKHKTLISDK